MTNNLKKKAIFLMFLIITIPLYSAIVYGQISRVYIGGSTGSDKFTKDGDQITVKVISSTPQIVNYDNIHSPYDCEKIVNTTNYLCIFNTVLTSYTGTNLAAIRLLNYNNTPILGSDPYDFYYVVDEAKPTVDMNVYQDPNDEGKVKIDFKINDTLNGTNTQATIYGLCSGFRSIKLYDNGKEFLELPIKQYVQKTCIYEEEEYLLDLDEGNHNIYLVVEDYAGNIGGSNAKKIVVDYSPPSITDNFELLELPSRQPLEALAKAPRNKYSIPSVIISIEIDDANLDTNSVVVDARKLNLNPAYASYYEKLRMFCSSTDNKLYNCFSSPETLGLSSGIKLNPHSHVLNITIKAKDIFGNSMTKVVGKTLTIDSNTPKIDKIITPYCNGNICYVNNNPTTISLITKPLGEKTLNNRLLTVDTSGLVPAQRVDSCSNQNGVWTCNLNIDPEDDLPQGESFEVSLTYPSVDDRGMEFESISGNITFDSMPPSIKSINYSSDSQEDWYFPNEFLEGERISAKVIVTDALSGVKQGTIDFSPISPGNNTVKSNSCTKINNSNDYECVWTDAVQAINPGKKKLNVQIYDHANNSVTEQKEISILSVSDKAGNFFSFGDYTLIPEKIDLVTLPYFPIDNINAWVTQTLSATNNAVALKIALTDNPKCSFPKITGNKSSNVTNLLSGGTIFRNTRPYSNGDSMLLSLALNKISVPADAELTVSCPVSIIAKSGSVLYQPQKLNMTFTLKTYVSKYVADATLKQQIEDLKDELGDDTWIDDIYEIFFWLQQICYTYDVIQKIMFLYNFVTQFVIEVLVDFQWTRAIGEAWDFANTGASQGIQWSGAEYFTWLCHFSDCTLLPAVLDSWYTGDGAGGNQEVDCGDGEDSSTVCKILKNWLMLANTYSGNWGGDNYVTDGGSDTSDVFGGLNSLKGSYYDIAKKSYLYSILLFCIPGFVYNLKQDRNIDCQYVYCVENEVISSGMHVYACDARKAYAKCLFTQGQIFNSLPFASLLSSLSNLIDLFSGNILGTVGTVIGAVCAFYNKGIMSGTCRIYQGISQVLGAISTVMGAWDYIENEGYVPPTDYCEEIDL